MAVTDKNHGGTKNSGERTPSPTETELAILGVLWERQPRTIRELVDSLYSEHKPSLHATVKSLLERLEEKGYVACDTGDSPIGFR